MVSVSLTLYHPSGDVPRYRANVYRIERTGERFMALDLGGEVTLTLDGFDEKASGHARVLAAVLLQAADQLEAERAADPPPAPCPDLPAPEPVPDLIDSVF